MKFTNRRPFALRRVAVVKRSAEYSHRGARVSCLTSALGDGLLRQPHLPRWIDVCAPNHSACQFVPRFRCEHSPPSDGSDDCGDGVFATSFDTSLSYNYNSRLVGGHYTYLVDVSLYVRYSCLPVGQLAEWPLLWRHCCVWSAWNGWTVVCSLNIYLAKRRCVPVPGAER